MPFNLYPINDGAEINAQIAWHNFLQLAGASGYTGNADTVDSYHISFIDPGTSLVAPSSIVVTDSNGYLPTGLIPASVLSGYSDNLFIRTSPASVQSLVRADIQNTDSNTTFNVRNTSTGKAINIENTSASLASEAANISISGLGGIGLTIAYLGATGTSVNPSLKFTSASGATKPFIVANHSGIDVFRIDHFGNITGKTITASGQLISTTGTGAPLSVSSSGFVSMLNADYLDGHHWSELSDAVSGYSGFLPLTGGTMTGPIDFQTWSSMESNTDLAPIFSIQGSAATSSFPVFQVQALGDQNVLTILDAASGTTFNIDSAGNVVSSGYVSGIQGRFNPVVGEPPLVVSASGWVQNLNADYLDNKHSSDFALLTDAVLARPDLTLGASQSGVRADIVSYWSTIPALTASNISGGTAMNVTMPYVSGSYSPALYVANYNILPGSTPIYLYTSNGDVTSGIAPIGTNSKALNVNLNSDLLDGYHLSDITTSGYLLLNVENEAIAGVDGVVSGFTVAWVSGYASGTISVYYNGIHTASGIDYLETNPGGGVFTFYAAPLSGSTVLVDYIKGS